MNESVTKKASRNSQATSSWSQFPRPSQWITIQRMHTAKVLLRFLATSLWRSLTSDDRRRPREMFTRISVRLQTPLIQNCDLAPVFWFLQVSWREAYCILLRVQFVPHVPHLCQFVLHQGIGLGSGDENGKKGFTQKWMRHRGFCTWGIQIGPFAACETDFVQKKFHLFTFHTGRSNFLLPQTWVLVIISERTVRSVLNGLSVLLLSLSLE